MTDPLCGVAALVGEHVASQVGIEDGVPANWPPPNPGQKHVDASALVIEHQLERASARLAMVLNRDFVSSAKAN